FFPAGGGKAEVPLMVQQEWFRYAEDEAAQVVELPYLKNELSLVVVLPRAKDGLAKVEAGLTADKLSGWAKAASSTQTRVYLPRFTTEKAFRLDDPLQALGMTSAFGAKADFSGMHAGAERLA